MQFNDVKEARTFWRGKKVRCIRTREVRHVTDVENYGVGRERLTIGFKSQGSTCSVLLPGWNPDYLSDAGYSIVEG